ncbi:hypothetical protein J1N35_009385 [Gossypium stocksii]|uniref:Uncharacterized protein n=1 Tax=Gossypium stocksii TaxID=47602 RepID=A0A9D3VZ65_9ROSI|nr:hypothetical protein J1N35_009385 [Gossypium stocksii]
MLGMKWVKKTMANQGLHLLAEAKLEGSKELERVGLNSNDRADFLGIVEVLGSKMVEATKELTKSLGTKHLIA